MLNIFKAVPTISVPMCLGMLRAVSSTADTMSVTAHIARMLYTNVDKVYYFTERQFECKIKLKLLETNILLFRDVNLRISDHEKHRCNPKYYFYSFGGIAPSLNQKNKLKQAKV